MREKAPIQYIVCRQDDDSDYEGTYRTYFADRPENAARQAAAHDHSHYGGWEWSWPIVYVVKDDATGKRWQVEVERETVPEFIPGKAVVIR